MTTNNNHPITPSPELVQQWVTEAHHQDYCSPANHIATQAAQWGSDQELEACCEYLTRCAAWEPEDIQEMHSLRRPTPPSLKEQALEALEALPTPSGQVTADRFALIRRALEQLDD